MGLEQVEMIMDAEDEFGVKITDAQGSVSTVGEFYDMVLCRIRSKANSDLAQRPDLEMHVWKRLAEIAASHGYDMKPEQITRETRFIEDLGYG